MTLNFEQYARTGNAIVRQVATELGAPEDVAKASRILRSTLHVLRDQSSPEESVQFMNQVPMFIKAIYADGWKLGSKRGHVRNIGEFVAAVGNENNDYSNEEATFQAAQAVFRVIRAYVSEGEIEGFRQTNPKKLREPLGI